MGHHTAAVIVVSKEILEAKIALESHVTLPLSLAPIWNIRKFVVIPPNRGIIEYELKTTFKTCDVVVVVQTIAEVNVCGIISEVFCESVAVNGEIHSEVEKPLPVSFKLLTKKDVQNASVVAFRGIFVLKGDPSAITTAFKNVLKPYLADYERSPMYKKKIEIVLRENGTQKFFDALKCDNVKLNLAKTNGKFVVTIETDYINKMTMLENEIVMKFGIHSVTSVANNLNIFDSFYFKVDPYIRQTIKIIEECFSKHSPSNVFVSFNGGKDCTVLLHLTLAVLQKNHPDFKDPLFCCYVRNQDAFPEQDSFIAYCQCYYNLEIMTVQNDIKAGLETILKRKPHLKACLMGTRRTDPHSSNLRSFQMTDQGWPQILRVFPLLDWHYTYIWDYLLYFNVPYCSLYDEGYTSLGNVTNTIRNPSLISYDVVEEKEVYLPAYKLMNALEERKGRR